MYWSFASAGMRASPALGSLPSLISVRTFFSKCVCIGSHTYNDESKMINWRFCYHSRRDSYLQPMIKNSRKVIKSPSSVEATKYSTMKNWHYLYFKVVNLYIFTMILRVKETSRLLSEKYLNFARVSRNWFKRTLSFFFHHYSFY